MFKIYINQKGVSTVTHVRKSYLSVFPLLLLLILPGFVRFLKIKTRVYSYDSKNLFVEEGVFNKNSMTIPLIKIESIQVRSNILGNGNVNLNVKVAGSKAYGMTSLEYIRNAKNEKNKIFEEAENARTVQGVKSIDTF